MGLLDLLFPKRCVACSKIGEYLCPTCFAFVSFTTHSICVVCNRNTLDGITHPGCVGKYTLDGVFASIVYKGIVKRLIYHYKYQPYISSLTPLLGELFYEGIIQHEIVYQIFARQPVLVPIPLHPSKYRQRGYNQAQLLAKELSRKTKLPILEGLIRVKKTVSQTTFAREDRVENIKGAFEIVPKFEKYLADKEIILIDDVFTSGATFSEAAKVLKKAGTKKVWGIALAHEE